MRYFGGNTNADIANLVNADGTPGSAISLFMTHIPNPPDRVYTLDSIPAPIPNSNAVFASFVGENTLNNIRALRGENLSAGFLDVRNFINDNLPVLSYVLGHMGEQTLHATSAFTDASGEDFEDTDINGSAANIPWDLGVIISEIFGTTRPFNELDNLTELGIADDPVRQAALMEDIKKLYDSNFSEIVYNHGVTESDVRKQLKTNTSFGVCPHFSFKVGYFYKEMNSCLYAKAGFILLKGQTSVISNYRLEKEEKFNKLAPFFAIGVSKMINKNWGVSAEVSHALKTHKKMSDIRWHGYKIENNVGISKTAFKILFTYTF
jgi:hypothetical protein